MGGVEGGEVLHSKTKPTCGWQCGVRCFADVPNADHLGSEGTRRSSGLPSQYRSMESMESMDRSVAEDGGRSAR